MIDAIRGFCSCKEESTGGLLENTLGLTSQEVHRLVSRLFGGGLVIGAVTMMALSYWSIVAWPIGYLVAIPCSFIAYRLIKYSCRPEHCDNPEYLKKLKLEARELGLSELIQIHGWKRLLSLKILGRDQFKEKYREWLKGKNLIQIMDFYEKTLRHLDQQHCRTYYSILPLSEFAKQWRTETQHLTYEQIIKTYPLDRLEKYNVVPESELLFIKNLKKDYDILKGYYDEKIKNIQSEHHQSTSEPEKHYNQECERIESLYRNHESVKELSSIAMHYAKHRQEAQQLQNLAKLEARKIFNEATSNYTNSGQISYAHLSKDHKEHYDSQLQLLNLAEEKADLNLRKQIEKIDLEHKNRLIFLNSAELTERKIKNELLKEAKKQYTLQISSKSIRKRISVIEKLASSCISDLNGRYRAYIQLHS